MSSVALNDEEAEKCLRLIENNDCQGLLMTVNADFVNLPIYPDGIESSKTRLIFYAIKQEKVDCVRLLLTCGADVNLGVWEDASYNKEYISVSPLHYCIERKSSVEIICVLVNQSDCVITESHIRGAILCDNPSALQLILESTQYRPEINIKDIIQLYAENSDVPIVETLEVLSKFIDFKTLSRSKDIKNISGTLTLSYFGRTRTNCSFEEADAIVKFCCKLKCTVDGKYARDAPLHAAMESYNTTFLKALVKNGAQVNRTNSTGKIPLYEAIRRNDNDLFEFLLKNGADSRQCNLNNSDRETSLELTIRNRHFKRVCRLVELDMNIISGKERKYIFPELHYILECFVKHRLQGETACETLVEIVEACLSKGFDINTKCPAEQNFTFADSNSLSLRGHTVFHIAIRFFSSAFCEELIALGADVNMRSEYNQCAYSLALDCSYTSHRDIEAVDESVNRLLLLEKYGVNLQDKLPRDLVRGMKCTPFPFTCPMLNEEGPNTPLRIILSSRNVELAESMFYLITNTATKELFVKDLHLALKTGSFRLSHLVIRNVNNEFNFRSILLSDLALLFESSFEPLLTFSPDSPEAVTIKTLAQRGFDINSIDDSENTIFHYACRSKRFSGEESVCNFIQLIIGLGGKKSIDSVNIVRQSPLHFALTVDEPHENYPLSCNRTENYPGRHFVKALLDHGANFRRKTHQGFSAIHIAINYGAVASIDLLVEKALPKNDVINCWRQLRFQRPKDRLDCIEEVYWPSVAPAKYYIVTPLTIAIMNKDKELIKLLITKYNAILTKKDFHNSFVLSNYNNLGFSNFLYEYLPKSISLKATSNDKELTLEYVFQNLTAESWRYVNSNDLLDFTMNFVSRKYDINSLNYPPVLFSLVKMMLQKQGNPFANIQLFNFLIEFSNCDFVCYYDPHLNVSLLTLLLQKEPCKYNCWFGPFGRDSKPLPDSRKLFCQRNYIIRMLLQRCSYSNWSHCTFESYTYHKEDFEILKCILLTGARTNLISQWPNIKPCQLVESDIGKVSNFISAEDFSKEIQFASRNPPTLAELSVMAIKNFSDVRVGLTECAFPERTANVIRQLDVDTDEDVLWELFNFDT